MTGPDILLIADDARLIQTTEEALQDFGRLVVRSDPDEVTLSLARNRSVAVLLVEVTIPAREPDWFKGLRAAQAEAVLLLLATPEQLPAVVPLTQYELSEIVLLPVSAAALRDAVARAMQRRRSSRELARLRALVPLYEMSRMFMLQTDLDELLHRVLETAVNETGAQRASLMLIDENRLYLTIQAAVGISTDVISQTQVRLGEGIAGWVAKTGQPLVVNGPDDLPEFLRQSMLGGVLRSALSLPLTAKGQVIGVINLTKTTLEAPFVLGDAELLSVLVGQAAVAIVNARLIKQMEAAYEELSRLEHLKTEFINIAAHELRSPVSIVLGYASLLAEMAPPEMQDLIDPLHSQARQLERIVDDLFHLDYLKSLKEFDPGVDIKTLDLADCARFAVREAQAVAEVRNLQLALTTPEPVWVLGDLPSLRRILRHLLDNALKFTPAGGQVQINVIAEGGEAFLRVQDTGPGVPSEERERIFAPFYQVGSSLRRSHGGMGLGLSLARRMVQTQGSRLWLQARPGPGASFCLALPLAPQKPAGEGG